MISVVDNYDESSWRIMITAVANYDEVVGKL